VRSSTTAETRDHHPGRARDRPRRPAAHPRHDDGARGLPPRLPRHVRDDRDRRGRRGHRCPRRPGAPVHPRRPLRQGQQLPGQGVQRRPRPAPDAAHGAQGQRPVRADHLGRGAGHHRRDVPREDRRARGRDGHAGELPRHPGRPQRAVGGRRVLPPPRRDDHRAHLLRLRGLHRLRRHGGRHRGRRPREPRALPLHHHLGLQHGLDEPAPVARGRRGAAAGREGRGHRPDASRDRAPRRLAHPDPPGHRRRPGARDDARDHRGGARRPRLRP
jgi:hypothetical protein